MFNQAINIIQEEHRSLAAIVHGLKYLVNDARSNTARADFKVLRAMLHYIDAFPERLHHPKEDAYVFARLAARTHEADDVIGELKKQHEEGTELVSALHTRLDAYEAGAAGGLAAFAEAVDAFTDAMWQHMALEEKVLLPLAKQHLSDADWVEIAEAFGENGDPRFSADAEDEFSALFSRIVTLAPPPIGVGPATGR
ncbi:MAG: hemerythrin domain-containing protein [Rhodocyclaceae bacterium]